MRSRFTPFLLCLAVAPTGCKPLLIPVARAFGAPSEHELVQWRETFERLRANYGTARVLVHPIVDPFQGSRGPGSAQRLAQLLLAQGWSRACPVRTPPPLPKAEPFHNQMRFVVNRAEAYAAWARSNPPEADFLLMVEVLRFNGSEVAGIHVYVVDGTGRIAYLRWLNSHAFGPEPPRSPMEVCASAVRTLMADLAKPATHVFPPHFIG